MDEEITAVSAPEENDKPIELPVNYRKLNTFFSDFTKNIRNGGTFLKTDCPLKEGTKFLFKLHIPVLYDPLEIKGVVIWAKLPGDPPDEHGDEPGMGIRYIYDDDEQRKAFENTVAQLMIDSLGQRICQKLFDGASKD